MISVIVPTSNSARLLPRCFDSLIGAVVRGIAGEVIVADSASIDATLAIADAVGARVVTSKTPRGELGEAAASARGDWLLFLQPETALEAGWENEAETFIQCAILERPRAAAFRFALDEYGPKARLVEVAVALSNQLLARSRSAQGLLIPKRFYMKFATQRTTPLDHVDLLHRIGRTRLVFLRARAISKRESPRLRESPEPGIRHAPRLPKSWFALRKR